jgi:hypothetical protein
MTKRFRRFYLGSIQVLKVKVRREKVEAVGELRSRDPVQTEMPGRGSCLAMTAIRGSRVAERTLDPRRMRQGANPCLMETIPRIASEPSSRRDHLGLGG